LSLANLGRLLFLILGCTHISLSKWWTILDSTVLW